MFWRKPEPLPKPKTPQWITVGVPIVFAVIVGLVGLVYNTMAADVKSLEEKKASRETIQQMLKNQENLIKNNKEDGDKRDKAIEKNQEVIQELLRQQIPRNLRVRESEVSEIEKKPIPPDYFEKYFELEEDIQKKYKIYLESKGYDTTGL